MFIKVNDAMRRRPKKKVTSQDFGLMQLMTHIPPSWGTLVFMAKIMADAVHDGVHEELTAHLPWRNLAAPDSDSEESEGEERCEDDEGDENSD